MSQLKKILLELNLRPESERISMQSKLLETYTNVKWLPENSTFELWQSNELPELNQTKSAFIMAFKNEDIILANVYGRGWDIPGGHIENSETPEEAIHRELFEETGASLLCSSLMGYAKITINSEKPTGYNYPFPISYMPIYWGMIDTISEPSASMEVGKPKLFAEWQIEKEKLIPYHQAFYKAGLARTSVFLKAMQQAV